MKRIRYLGVSAFAVLMAFMVMSATPGTALAGGCTADYIAPWTTFTLNNSCSLTGDVYMGQYPNGTKQFDDNGSTGLVVTCVDINGCPGYTVEYAASMTDQSSDVAAQQLRASGCNGGCWDVSQVSWPDGNGGQVVPQTPVQPLLSAVRFNAGQAIWGAQAIWLDNGRSSTTGNVWIYYAPTSGWALQGPGPNPFISASVYGISW